MTTDDLPKLRGRQGEERLRRELVRCAEKAGGIFAVPDSSVILPTKTGGLTEIDAVLVHATGVYVFENKCMQGAVSGRADDRLWTQTGERVLSFPNPVLQNRRHAMAAAAFLGVAGGCVTSFVVFNDGCDISRVETGRGGCIVTALADLDTELNPLLAGREVFSAKEAGRLCDALRRAASPNRKMSAEHEAAIIQERRKRRSERKKGRAPRD